jgi:hypothetical protein
MIRTEDEAKQKQCPLFHAGDAALYLASGGHADATHGKCRASGCMMWRWDGGRGYCGLAYNNHRAMSDALDHILDSAKQALGAAE